MGWNMDKEDLKDIIEKNKDELFSEIAQEINNDNVTDIEWDGYNLWITELGIGSYISGKELSDRYVENVSIKLANIMGVSFNRSRPILEANTEKLRISIWHESRCHKKSMSIRKIPEYLRFSHKDLVESDYAPFTAHLLNYFIASYICDSYSISSIAPVVFPLTIVTTAAVKSKAASTPASATTTFP
jgi:pilus assembly protein CpaF